MEKQFLPLILSLFLFISLPTQADQVNEGTFFGSEAPGKWIIGVKAAHIENDADETDDTEGVGIILGYEFARPVGTNGTSTVEFEYITADDAEVHSTVPGEWGADIYSLYFTYRSPGTLYFKAKAGVQYSSVDINVPGFNSEYDDTALALGVGLGYHFEDYGVIELEYSKDSGDNDIGIFGLNALLEF